MGILGFTKKYMYWSSPDLDIFVPANPIPHRSMQVEYVKAVRHKRTLRYEIGMDIRILRIRQEQIRPNTNGTKVTEVGRARDVAKGLMCGTPPLRAGSCRWSKIYT